MADLQQLAIALKNADAAGDTEAARKLAGAIQQMQGNQVETDVAPNAQSRIEGAFEDAGRINPLELDGQDPISAKFLQGVTFKFGDEIIGGIQAPIRALRDGIPISQAFQEGRQAFNNAATFADQNNPNLATAAEIGGALSTGAGLGRAGLLASSKLAPQAGLGARTAAAAKDGAVAGALFGAGAGDSLQERTTGAASSAALGAGIGGVIPGVGTAAKGITAPVINAVKARVNPQGFASQKISERLAADGTDLNQVQARLRDGMNIADVAGHGSRDLLRTSTNIAGNARNSVTTRLTQRQIGQGDRLKNAISRTFADPDSFLAVKDDLAASAKAIADPLYEKAYSNPVPFTRELEDVLNTSAGKRALQKATEIASNEQAPFAQWFANIADDGTAQVKRVPDMRAWDYIKRGLDDVIEGQTDNITGKITTSGRAVVGLKKRMLGLLDEANPDYAQARKAFSGFAQIDEALEFGKSATRLSPEAVRRKISNMSASEKEAARIGMAETLRKQIDDSGFTHNAIRKIMGNRSQFQRLRALFDNQEQFKQFRKSIISEARKQRTFDAVRGNSTTARQLADMQDAGQLGEIGGAISDGAQLNVGRLIARVGSILTRMGGVTPEVAESIGQQLTSTNPKIANQIVNRLQNIERANISSERKSALISDALNRVLLSQATPALSGQ